MGRTMSVIVGSGEYTYRVEEGWAKLPPGYEMNDIGGVGVDRQDRVYVFHRGAHPMLVFDREGNFLRSWGDGIFSRPHGVHIAPDDSIYCTDDGDHSVRKCTLEGKVLLTLGIPGRPAPKGSGEPFNRCTHTALSPQGDIYVSDGYGNSRIHKYSPDGKLLFSWGETGTDPGQFNLPHNISCDADGWVYVADRENHRIQVFDGSGTTCTVRAACTCRRASAQSAILEKSDLISPATAACRTWDRASASSTTAASCWQG
jgi:DNA-binding beta-propeller fold protein YncE